MAEAVPVIDDSGDYLVSGGSYVIQTDAVATPYNISDPDVTVGQLKPGNQITRVAGTWTDGTLTYQVESAPNATPDPGDITQISGATSSSYTIQSSDSRQFLRFRERSTNANGYTDAYTDWVGPITGKTKFKKYVLLST